MMKLYTLTVRLCVGPNKNFTTDLSTNPLGYTCAGPLVTFPTRDYLSEKWLYTRSLYGIQEIFPTRD